MINERMRLAPQSTKLQLQSFRLSIMHCSKRKRERQLYLRPDSIARFAHWHDAILCQCATVQRLTRSTYCRVGGPQVPLPGELPAARALAALQQTQQLERNIVLCGSSGSRAAMLAHLEGQQKGLARGGLGTSLMDKSSVHPLPASVAGLSTATAGANACTALLFAVDAVALE